MGSSVEPTCAPLQHSAPPRAVRPGLQRPETQVWVSFEQHCVPRQSVLLSQFGVHDPSTQMPQGHCALVKHSTHLLPLQTCPDGHGVAHEVLH